MCVFDSFLLHHVHFNAARFAVVRFYLNSIYFAAEMCLSVKYFADVDREIDTTKELRRIVQLLVMFQVEDYIHAFYMKQQRKKVYNQVGQIDYLFQLETSVILINQYYFNNFDNI